MPPPPSSQECVTLGTVADAVAQQNSPFGCAENFRCARGSNGDMTYVFSLSTLQTGPRFDLYTMGNLGAFPDTPVVIAHVESRASAAQGIASAAPVIRSGDTVVVGQESILTTSYVDYSTSFFTDPANGMPWTIASINNLEAGVRHAVLGNLDARTTAVWLEICPAPPTPTPTITRTPTITATATHSGTPTVTPTATQQIDCDGAEFQVNTTYVVDQYDPDVAKDNDGNFVVVWTDTYGDGSGYRVSGQRFSTSGSPVGSEFQVNSTTTSDQLEPAVSAGDLGDFVVVWTSYYGDGSGSSVRARRYTSSGVPIEPDFQVNTSTNYGQSEPDVATDGFSNFVVVWHDNNVFGEGIKGQRYFNFGLEDGTEFLVTTFTDASQSKPAVAVDPAGNFVVVWESYGGEGGTDQDGSFGAVVGQRFSSTGASAGTEFVVNTYTVSSQQAPDVAVADDGDFVVVWESYGQDGDGNGVFAQRYNSDGSTAGTEFRVNTTTAFDQDGARVAVDSTGDFVVVWESYRQDDPTRNGIFGQRYSSGGGAIGTEFQVNTYTTGNQAYPAVAADAGNFVVVWEDGDAYVGFETPPDPARGGAAGGPPTLDGQDGSGVGVFGKNFIVFGVCGNAILEGGEVCDDGEQTDFCDDDCTVAVCGDGNINEAAGEQCDPPNGDNCDVNCQVPL